MLLLLLMLSLLLLLRVVVLLLLLLLLTSGAEPRSAHGGKKPEPGHEARASKQRAVSYTHLTLPTICSV